MKKIFLILLFLYITNGHSQSIKNYSNAFLNIGVDARSLSLSKAVVAHTDNVSAAYWNPAGLINVADNQLSLMHASYFANIAQFDYAGFAQPIDNQSALGLSLIRFGVDDILNTTQLIDANGAINYNNIQLFSTADYAFLVSYARKFPLQGINVGVNAKIIRRIIGKFADSWGVGFDIGLQYQSRDNWYFGIMARDITTTYNTWRFDAAKFDEIKNALPGENNTPPATSEITLPTLQLGISKKWDIRYDYSLLIATNLLASFQQTNDLISGKNISIDPAIGAEFGFLNTAFLRAGVGNFQKITNFDGSKNLQMQPNFGVGFSYKGISVDYALTDIGNASDVLYSNIFSLTIDLSIFR